jgi:secondary thiamine-phosphate synthase enzyme
MRGCLLAVWVRPLIPDAAPHRRVALTGDNGAMRSETIVVETGSKAGVFDITPDCQRFVSGAGDGLLSVFVPHATAGLAIMETAARSEADLLALLDRLAPADDSWRHRHGSLGHGRDHVIPALVAPSLVVPVLAGRLQLGTWQSVCLVDTNVDNSDRTVRVSFLAG